MKNIITTFVCDTCGAVIGDDNAQPINAVLRNSVTEEVIFDTGDLCSDCLSKVTQGMRNIPADFAASLPTYAGIKQ